MSTEMKYKCVNCGKGASALYKTYGPSVLKLTKCEDCKGVVDKYIEYDPVIVMIDLVLMSREAQRHVIYNTEFKSYWKLFIILMILETYGLWRNSSLFNIVVNSICNIQTNSTINSTYINLSMDIPLSESMRRYCKGWVPNERVDDNDLFIWEKEFYVQFMSTFAGIMAFIFTVHTIMRLFLSCSSQKPVGWRGVGKAFSLANMAVVLGVPMLVWGPDLEDAHTRAFHFLLVYLYSLVIFYHVFTVLYECSMATTIVALALANCAKYCVTFHATPTIRGLVS